MINRRSFLKRLLVGFGAVVAAPVIAKIPEVKETGHAHLAFKEETDFGINPALEDICEVNVRHYRTNEAAKALADAKK